MKKLIFLAMGAGLLASCGTSADGRLTLFVPAVATEYRLENGDYVGCDNVDPLGIEPSAPASTKVRVRFTASGAISSAQVRLDGVTTNDRDQNFKATFAGNDLKSTGTNAYEVYFQADALTDELLPSSRRLQPQAIVITPAATTIKIVSATNRTGNNQGGFRAELTGFSDGGFQATAPMSSVVPVFSNCTVISDTGTVL